jgi:hypothetical protein
VSAYAEEKESSTKAKGVPLEKKLDKRGLLNLGYGYGINGLDVGYIGGGHQYGGAYHQSAPVIESAPFAHHYGGGYGGHQHGGHYQSHAEPFYLGQKTHVQKTVTLLKGVPVPYEVNTLKVLNHKLRLLNAIVTFLGHQTRSL